jgi:hypothetical protein
VTRASDILLNAGSLRLARVRLVLQCVVIMRVSKVIITRELFKSLASGLGNKESSEDTEKHEESVDLENVVHPRGFVSLSRSTGTEDRDSSLAYDRTYFTRSSRDTVGGRSVASWEDFAGYDERGGVGAEVEEELGKNVNSEETIGGDMIVSESHNLCLLVSYNCLVVGCTYHK